jgi:hypothetical protein
MQTIQGFDFFSLKFDEAGKLASRLEFEALTAHVKGAHATDAVFIAHGFRNDEMDATNLYTTFLKALRADLARPEFAELAARRFVVAGVYWPSKPFKEAPETPPSGTRGIHTASDSMADAKAQLEDMKRHDASRTQRPKLDKAIALLPVLESDPKAQDEFVKLVLSLLKHSPPDKTEGLPQIRKRPGSELLARLSASPVEGTRGLGSFFGSIAGGVGTFLNLTQWYLMKDRSGLVGATGVASAVRDLHTSDPSIRLHLVGHSLGGRVMAGCAKGLCEPPVVQVDTLMLLEAAFSHFGFSPDNGHGVAGFFREVVEKQLVKGTFVSTFSAQDSVVGYSYSIMSRLAGDNTREIGDASDEFGGIGRNGALKTPEVATVPLHAAGTAYAYKANVINNLDGSGGLIKDHNDVTNGAITYAFASAMARA